MPGSARYSPAMQARDQLFRLFRALAVFFAVVAVVVPALALSGQLQTSGNPWLGAAVVAGLAAVFGVVAAGARQGASWGRYGAMVLGCLMLPAFPLGTYLGIRVLRSTGRAWSER